MFALKIQDKLRRMHAHCSVPTRISYPPTNCATKSITRVLKHRKCGWLKKIEPHESFNYIHQALSGQSSSTNLQSRCFAIEIFSTHIFNHVLIHFSLLYCISLFPFRYNSSCYQPQHRLCLNTLYL